jgi:restriction endonuclease S subunit
LEGLEISEVLLSQLEHSGRLDSEYYRPECLKLEHLLRGRSSTKLGYIADFLIGPFGSAFAVENYTDDRTYRYIRGKDVKPMRLMDDDNVYMPVADFDRLSKYALKKGDILVSVVGTTGNAAIVERDDLPAIFSCKSTVTRVRDIDAHYLLTYFDTKFGQLLLKRKERGAVQMGLNLDDLKTLDVYIAGSDFQKAVAGVYKKTVSIEKSSKRTFAEAELLLLDILGLKNYSPELQSVNVKTYKDSFASTGRLDAEHYQPKYDQLHQALIKHSGGTTTVGELADEIANGAEVREYQESGTPYLRVGDLKFLDIEASSVVNIDPVSAETGLKKIDLQIGDVLISRSGSLAISAVVEAPWDKALISSHLIRLRIVDKRINPYFLALFFMTLPGKMQIQKWSNGGVQPEISQPALKAIVVPIPPMAVQLKIRDLILNARQLRARSKGLLEAAKRAVEIAIEQDEAAGMAYLAREYSTDEGV